MNCIRCGHEGTSVLDTRRMPGVFALRRRRKCDSCGHVFPTYEIDGGIWGTVHKWAVTGRSEALNRRLATKRRDEEIVRRVKSGEKRYMLAEEYGLASSTISHICTQAGLPKKVRYPRKKHAHPDPGLRDLLVQDAQPVQAVADRVRDAPRHRDDLVLHQAG
jgi:hypothetical protein